MARELRNKPGTKSLSECDSEKDEYQQQQQKMHDRHAANEDICVVKYVDDELNASALVMSRASTRKKWQLCEGLPYNDLLHEGDVISVKTTKKQDPLERFFPAKVFKMTTDLAVAKTTMDSLLPKQKKSKKDGIMESTPTKRKDQEEFLSELDPGYQQEQEGANGLPLNSPERLDSTKKAKIWNFDPVTGKPLGLQRATQPVYEAFQPIIKRELKIHGPPKYTGLLSSEDDSDGEGVQWVRLPPPKDRLHTESADGISRTSGSAKAVNACGLPLSAMRSAARRPESTPQSMNKQLAVGTGASFPRTPSEFYGHENRDERMIAKPAKVSTPPSAAGRSIVGDDGTLALDRESTPTLSHEPTHSGQKQRYSRKLLESASGSAKKLPGIHRSPVIAKNKGGISQEQKDLALHCRAQLRIRSKEKCELYPGAGVFLPKGQFANFEVNAKPKNALLDGVNLAVMFFRNTETAAKIFRGDHYGVKAALGPDLLSELMAYVNGYHPGAKDNKIKEGDLIAAFSRKMYYIRKQMAKEEEQSQRVSTPE